jgi:hypothetical protein
MSLGNGPRRVSFCISFTVEHDLFLCLDSALWLIYWIAILISMYMLQLPQQMHDFVIFNQLLTKVGDIELSSGNQITVIGCTE